MSRSYEFKSGQEVGSREKGIGEQMLNDWEEVCDVQGASQQELSYCFVHLIPARGSSHLTEQVWQRVSFSKSPHTFFILTFANDHIREAGFTIPH